jgi:hypothetical protein
MKVTFVLLLAALATAACDSPEKTRTRGGGAGADVGNRPAKHVRMHEGSNQFWRTPDRIPVEGPSLEPARQAQQLSRQ